MCFKGSYKMSQRISQGFFVMNLCCACVREAAAAAVLTKTDGDSL